MHLEFDRSTKMRILMALTAVAVLAASLLPPIPQDAVYHRFADERSWLGIPNAANVLSNLPFVVVGVLGLRELIRSTPAGALAGFRLGYLAFFTGIATIGLGSAHYHWRPDLASLVWDRLPMTVAFMALVSIVMAEHLSERLARRLFWPLEALGVGSVCYWYLTETWGVGDLRWYGLVQFLPMLWIPLVLWWFPSRFDRPAYLWALLGGYALAKLCELLDQPLYESWLGISGHTLKHLVAAAAAATLLLAVRHRQPRPAAPAMPP